MAQATVRPQRRSRREPIRIYQMHIALQQVQPLVWRRVLVPDTLTLAQLDRFIQAVFGWTNSHLHEFRIGESRYGMPSPHGFDDSPLLDERKTTVAACLGDTVTRFDYLYDFGDGWHHSVSVEQSFHPTEVTRRPMCVAGANACPPEDIGGPPGYMQFLEAILDPGHPDHAEMWEWWGGPFDPAGFDLNSANALIKRLRI